MANEVGRQLLKDMLEQCTGPQQDVFRNMYGHRHPEWTLDQIVDDMPGERVSWALEQVERTIKNNKR